MIVAKIRFNGICAETLYRKTITAGMKGVQVEIVYASGLWDGLNKTVVFHGVVTKDVVTNDTVVTIPEETVEKPNAKLKVGVYGVDADKNIAIPTMWADLGNIQDATDPSGDATTDPSLPVWAQLQAMIGDLGNLDTAAKENLVAAVNEALTKGGSVDEATIQKIVDEYLAANPPTVTETDPTVPDWAKQPKKPTYTAAEVGADSARYNALNYGIKGDGKTDDTQAIQALFDSADWFTDIYFPPGTYKITAPLTLGKRINIYGNHVSFTAAERIHTVFKFVGLEPGSVGLTTDYFTLVRDITFETDTYVFSEDRDSFLADRKADLFTTSISTENVSAIKSNSYCHFENLYFYGFSGTCIVMQNYGLAKNISCRQCHTGLVLGTDNIVDNIRCVYGNKVIADMGGENIISCVRADSMIDCCVTIHGGQNQLSDMLFDWCYKNAVNVYGNGNTIEMSSGRVGIYTYGVNPATTPSSYTGDNGRDFSVIRLTCSGTYKPYGNRIKITGYKCDLSDDNRGIWLYTPYVSYVTDGGIPGQNFLDLTIGDIDLLADDYSPENYRRFINIPYTSYSFDGMAFLNYIPVKFTGANRDNYDTAFLVVSITDIVNDLVTNVANKPLSAAQGVVIKALIDALSTDKLDADELTNAINTALAQAKASGEFDGTNGSDGGYYTPSVTQPDANTMTVAFTPSKDGMPEVPGKSVTLPAGTTGATPNIQIGTVKTLPAGSDATADISGTPENPVLNLGIPQGAPGSGEGGGISVTGATVGQTVKIAAVDDDGVPTAWEAVDFPSGVDGESWELLETVTMEADTNYALVTLPYPVKKLFVYSPASSSALLQSNSNIRLATGIYGYNHQYFGESITSFGTNTWVGLWILTDFTISSKPVCCTWSGVGTAVTTASAQYCGAYTSSKTPEKFYITTANGATLFNASTWYVYGVKA